MGGNDAREILRMKPDPTTHNPDPAYIQSLIDRAGLSQRKAAKAVGIGERTMRSYVNAGVAKQECPYLVQFALECLAE